MEPFEVLKGDAPRLIDEWQEVPSLWDATRSFVDLNNKKGLIILTCSSTPTIRGILHSVTGRIKSIRMNTMSLYESGDSTGDISLKELCNNRFETRLYEEVNLKHLVYLIVRGGRLGNIEVNQEDCCELASGYMENVIKTDLQQLDNDIEYNEHKAKLILKYLARNESATASNQNILKDII